MRASWPYLLLLATGSHSPAVDVFGSYFPAWMACIVIGLGMTIIVRLLLVGCGLHSHLRPKALVYPCMVVLFTLAVWLVYFKN